MRLIMQVKRIAVAVLIAAALHPSAAASQDGTSREPAEAPVVLVREQADDFDWDSALIGASVPLALLLLDLLVNRHPGGARWRSRRS